MADYVGANNATSLNGLFKEVYEDNLKRLIPDGKKILQAIKFVSKDKMPGNAYH